MAFGRCYICEQESHAVESHHIVPQATGGANMPTIPLCGTCHSLVHAQALNILSRQETRNLFPESQTERAAKVVRFVVLAIRREREDPNFTNPATFHLKTTKGTIALLHALKAEAGYSNLNAYVEAVLKRQIAGRFPGFGTKPEHPVNSKG